MSERDNKSSDSRSGDSRGNSGAGGFAGAGGFTGPRQQQPRPKPMKVSASGVRYIDYKENESLRRLMSGNGKLQSRKRNTATALEQRMIAQAIKRARYMALVPYVNVTQ